MRILWTGMVACALVLASGVATADSGDHAPHVQSSMVITGTITIKPDGSVADYTLDKKDKLPAGVLKAMATALPHWMFQPVRRDGKAVLAKSRMRVKLVANPIGHGRYGISIDGASFGKTKSDEILSEKHITLPVYPVTLVRMYVSGTVYMVLQVGRDGHVEQAKVWHVDLRIKGTSAQMKWWRQRLADACVHASKHWTFNPPTKGPNRDDDHWWAIMPLTFSLSPSKMRAPYPYGRWWTYIPGPKHHISWMDQHLLAASAGAIPANGGLYPMQQSLHLLTPLGDGG